LYGARAADVPEFGAGALGKARRQERRLERRVDGRVERQVVAHPIDLDGRPGAAAELVVGKEEVVRTRAAHAHAGVAHPAPLRGDPQRMADVVRVLQRDVCAARERSDHPVLDLIRADPGAESDRADPPIGAELLDDARVAVVVARVVDAEDLEVRVRLGQQPLDAGVDPGDARCASARRR
jgi:hypothetical protein